MEGGGGELGTNESGVGGYEVYEESCKLPMGYMYVYNNAYIIQVGSAYKIVVYNT